MAAVIVLTTGCNDSDDKGTPVNGVTVSPTVLTLTVGDRQSLQATVSPGDADIKGVRWRSDNTAVASVINGEVTAESPGTAIITVSTEDAGFRAQCAVTVNPVIYRVESVSLNKHALDDFKVGSTETLTPSILPANASNQNVSWVSDNPDVATVNAEGQVRAVAPGTAMITVTTEDGGKTDRCTVTVIDRGDEKRIAFVYDPNMNSYSADAGNLARVMQGFTFGDNEVTTFEHPGSDGNRGHANEPSEASLLELYEAYDLIVVHSTMDGQNSHVYGLAKLVGKKNILNMKAFNYTADATPNSASDRWGWGSPNNASAGSTSCAITVAEAQQSHPVFDGLAFDGTSLEIYAGADPALPANRFQSITNFPYTGANTRWNSEWTALSAELASFEGGMVIHEINLPAAKYMMIGFSHEGNANKYLTDDAIQLLRNAVRYLCQ